MSVRKKIVLLGATGSVGQSALKVIEKHADRLELVGIAANRNVDALARIAQKFEVRHIGIFDETVTGDNSGKFAAETKFYPGLSGLRELACLPESDTTLVAVVGTHSLFPALDAIKAGKTLALANKEILVLAGKFIMQAAAQNGTAILPVDSEHNALFQCLAGIEKSHVEKLILTGSGGSFRELPLTEFGNVTVKQALTHPNWDMGPKVTIDSSTMANKGLEMIEARWLFGMKPEQIDVVIQPQSIIHSMIQCIDGSVIAQLCPPDMTFPVQHCLLHPERRVSVTPPFRPVDLQRYPCLRIAKESMKACGMAPGIFNAANEIAVDAFVQGGIQFTDIPLVIEKTLESVENKEPSSIDEVLFYDQKAREVARDAIAQRA